jgi:acetyl-CoA carboxylase biotin carboxyl carrier protein
MRCPWQTMTPNEIKELVELLAEKDIAEFEMERDDVKLRIKRSHEAPATTVVTSGYPAPVAAPVALPQAAPAAPAAAPAAAAAAPAAAPSEEGLAIIKSPIVGTFYEASSPGAPPFVREGDTVAVGQVLCIVEAMKLMNEIESDTAGTIVKILVSNGQPVEYGQPLFKVRPR